MNAPKISVIIPMYNRKHYIRQCLDSVLAQTFRDFEVIVRDDGSTDGSADFVAEKFADEISSGRLKLRRNEKNIGEFPTDNRLLREATGKYIMILHSDDLYLPHALAHMYSVAEHFNADVVHGCRFFKSPKDGIITQGTQLKIELRDRHQVEKISLMSADLSERFHEWADGGTFIDAQYNIFRRKFILDNEIFFESIGNGMTGGNRFLAMRWIMAAKVFVKTPVPFYIRRDAPDSITNSVTSPERVGKFISAMIKLSRRLDELFTQDEFFRNNREAQYLAKSNFFLRHDKYWIIHRGIYKNGVTPEIYAAVEEAFKKHFGDDASYPMFLFHWIHAAIYGHSADINNTPPRSVDSEFLEAA